MSTRVKLTTGKCLNTQLQRHTWARTHTHTHIVWDEISGCMWDLFLKLENDITMSVVLSVLLGYRDWIQQIERIQNEKLKDKCKI
jgi:hypothetical protein